MATALKWSRMGVYNANAESRDYHYDKLIDKYIAMMDKVPRECLKYMIEEKTDNISWTLQGVTGVLGLPRKITDTDPVSFDEAPPTYPVTCTIDTFANAVAIERTLRKIDRSGKIGTLLGGLPNSALRYLELKAADFFNSGESTTGADGSYMFATDHYYLDASVGSWSNYETAAALTTTSLNTMAVSMRTRKNERGLNSGGYMLKKLLIPPALREKAVQVAQSDKVPETSTNAANAYKGISYEEITGFTDTNRFFGVGDQPDKNGMYYVVLTAPEVRKLAYPSAEYPNIDLAYDLYMQVGFAAGIPENIHVNVGA